MTTKVKGFMGHYTSFFVTDAPERFIRVGQRFLGEKVESAVRIER